MKGPHAEELRVAWLADSDPVVACRLGLTADRVVKPEGLDLPGLLDQSGERWPVRTSGCSGR